MISTTAAVGIQARCQPGRGNFLTRTRNSRRVVALDQRVIIGQKEKRIDVGLFAAAHRRADRAYIVTQVRGASGGDASKYARGHVKKQ